MDATLLIDAGSMAHFTFYSQTKGLDSLYQHFDKTVTKVKILGDSRCGYWRSIIWPLYKANRSKKDPELLDHIKRCYDLWQPDVIPMLEADDLIAKECTDGINKIIVSVDSDLDQLVDPDRGIYRWTPRDWAYCPYGESWRLKRAMKVVAGDSSDNWPGLKGIGPKKADVMLRKQSFLQTILDYPFLMIGVQLVDLRGDLIERVTKAIQDGKIPEKQSEQ